MFPNVEAMFRSDIKTMQDFCALAQPEHLVMLQEVEKQFLTEFDFREEAKNLELVRKNMRRAYPRKASRGREGEGEGEGVSMRVILWRFGAVWNAGLPGLVVVWMTRAVWLYLVRCANC